VNFRDPFGLDIACDKGNVANAKIDCTVVDDTLPDGPGYDAWQLIVEMMEHSGTFRDAMERLMSDNGVMVYFRRADLPSGVFGQACCRPSETAWNEAGQREYVVEFDHDNLEEENRNDPTFHVFNSPATNVAHEVYGHVYQFYLGNDCGHDPLQTNAEGLTCGEAKAQEVRRQLPESMQRMTPP
jgi:hypothetical protein